MATTTPRRSLRIPHQHTPKMSERKKGLFQSDTEASRDSLTKHRELTVVDSESESDDCDLGIMGALDTSSSDENDHNVPKTPVKSVWRTATRSQTSKLKDTSDLKSFIKSPFTLKKYQTRYSCPDKCSVSTPASPQHGQPKTPSSTRSCNSGHTTTSSASKARKSLASLIADTESCSSSLKDLNFDSDSASDSKENTPTRPLRRSNRHKMTPKLVSFKGILMEQKKNLTPLKEPVVSLTPMDMNKISPTQLMKTPHNSGNEAISPPKLGHRRNVQIEESPESACESDKSNKRLHYDNKNDIGPNSKVPRLDGSKARLSLFNCDRLKEILSTKSFYGKSNPELNTQISAKISHVIQNTSSHRRRLFPQSTKRKRRPGQINMGVRHRIRKPTALKNRGVVKPMDNASQLNRSKSSAHDSMLSDKNVSMVSQDSQENENEKADPFDNEKHTIDNLLSQWTEEEVPETEMNSYKPRPELPCFSSTVIAETEPIFQPVTAVPVPSQTIQGTEFSAADLLELGIRPLQDAQRSLETQAQNINSSKIQTLQDTQNINSLTSLQESQENINTSSLPQKPLETTPLPVRSQNMAIIGQNVSQMAHHLSKMARNVTVLAQNVSQMAQDVVMAEPLYVDDHGETPQTGGDQFLPVEGGYILVDDTAPTDEVVPDLDAIEREMEQLDEILRSNGIVVTTDSQEPPQSSGSKAATTTAGPPKLYPIFSNPNPGTTTTKACEKPSKKPVLKTGSDQYVIDAGQKRFGATQCTECGVIYQIGDAQDEHDHLVHHNATDVLKFNGLKEEYVVGRAATARCIRIRGGDAGWRKVEQLLDRVVHPQLGYGASLLRQQVHAYTAYLYVDKRQIVGCLICEPKVKAHKLVPGEPDCCSVETYPVKCGISRVWTHHSYRRRGLASRLLDCARASFLHGSALAVDDLAFSAPTASGKRLAAAYMGREDFYVYVD